MAETKLKRAKVRVNTECARELGFLSWFIEIGPATYSYPQKPMNSSNPSNVEQELLLKFDVNNRGKAKHIQTKKKSLKVKESYVSYR